MQYFDYENCAREAGLSDDELDRLRAVIRNEFPTDEMMYELHLVRACFAIKDGHTTIDRITSTHAV